jgi:hypothetical protein
LERLSIDQPSHPAMLQQDACFSHYPRPVRDGGCIGHSQPQMMWASRLTFRPAMEP